MQVEMLRPQGMVAEFLHLWGMQCSISISSFMIFVIVILVEKFSFYICYVVNV